MADSTGGVRWQDRPPRLLAAIAAGGLVIALGAGFVGGYLVEKSRTTSEVKKLKQQTAAKNSTSPTTSPKAGTPGRIVGTVSSVTPSSVTIKIKSGSTRKVTVSKTTAIVKASSGSASDVVADVRVLVAGAADGSETKSAKAIIVLPTDAHAGKLVRAVDGTSMSLKAGTTVTKVTISGATVSKVSPATIADVKDGASVVVQDTLVKGKLIATEIVIMPSGSTFG